MGDCLQVQVERTGTEVIVRLTGEIDMANAEQIRECLLAVDEPIVTVELSAVTFIDSSGFRAFAAAQEHVRDRDGKLVLYGLQPAQMRTLEVLGMTGFFDSIVPD